MRALVLVVLVAAAAVAPSCAPAPLIGCDRNGATCNCTGGHSWERGLAECSTDAGELCCATSDYPTGQQSSCVCRKLDCVVSSTGCNCTTPTFAPKGTTSCASTWMRCCMHSSGCRCDNTSTQCAAGDVRVTSCTPAQFTCTGGMLPVSSCGSPFD